MKEVTEKVKKKDSDSHRHSQTPAQTPVVRSVIENDKKTYKQTRGGYTPLYYISHFSLARHLVPGFHLAMFIHQTKFLSSQNHLTSMNTQIPS